MRGAGERSDLRLLLWNRLDPEQLDVAGDRAVLDTWPQTVRIRWAGPPPPGLGAPPAG